MAGFRSIVTVCIGAVVGCSSTEPPTGPLTGNWAWRGSDASSNYVNLALTQAGTQVHGTMQYCRPTGCGGHALSSAYVDSAFDFDLGVYSFGGSPTSASLSGRLLSTDTVVAILSNLGQATVDTVVLLRTVGGQSATPP